MYKHVEWLEGIGPLLGLFREEYSKCNIWPMFANEIDYSEIMTEELQEALKVVSDLECWLTEDAAPSEYKPEEIRPLAIKAICELLQVIAVCDKWEGPHRDAQKDTLEIASAWLNTSGHQEASKALDAEFDL